MASNGTIKQPVTPKIDQSILNEDAKIMESFGFNVDRANNNALSFKTPPPAQSVNANNNSNNGFNPDAYKAQIDAQLSAQAEAFKAQQKAMLDSNFAQQTAQLKQAYEEAVAQGQISIRDAETQFAEQKKMLEQKAYQDTQKTALYGQEMGIQNSQQQVGLMQGDQARASAMNNANISTRDKRINDIRDRLNAITKQKDLDLARVQSEYNAGILGAQGQADYMKSSGMLDLLKTDYSAQLQQSFAQQNMKTQQGYDLEKMGVGQKFDLEKMATQFGYDLKGMQEQSKLRVAEMTKAHGFDLEKMAKSLENDIKMAGVQFGYSSRLQSQAHANSMAEASARFKQQVALAEKEANAQKKALESAYLDKNSTEYKIRMAQIDEAKQIKTADIYSSIVAEATITSILEDPVLKAGAPTAPFNYAENSKTGLGGMYNFLTGYDTRKAEYDVKNKAYQDALNRKNSLLGK